MSDTTTEQSGSKRGKSKLPPEICHEVRLLPEGMQAALRQLMVEGAMVEYAADAVNARHDWDIEPEPGAKPYTRKLHPVITVEAVRHFYQSDPQLQRERAQFFVSSTNAITQALSPTGTTHEGQSNYVRAVVTAGLVKVGEKDTTLAIRDSVRQFNEMENLRLKNRLMGFRNRELTQREKYREAQQKLAEEKTNFVKVQTEETRQTLRKLEKKRHLTPETFQKIREMYGMFSANVARCTPGPTLEQIDELAGPPPSHTDIESEDYMVVNEAEENAQRQQLMDSILKPAEETPSGD